MPKITKKAKSVDIIRHEVVETYPEYTCPSCLVTYIGSGPGKSTVRFKCTCGQELIVKNNKYVSEGHASKGDLIRNKMKGR